MGEQSPVGFLNHLVSVSDNFALSIFSIFSIVRRDRH